MRAKRRRWFGAYYYPWYGDFGGGHDLDQSLRGHLLPPQGPAIGDYSSRDTAAIAAHIDQSHRGNIDFWAASWWGPASSEDRTLRNSILTHPRASELRYAVHYESTGRFGSFSDPDFSTLTPDFEYLADHYFGDPNYLRFDGRPVVFIYLTRAYFNSQTARDAVADLRATIQSECGYDPYIVGDDFFSSGRLNSTRAQLWDAVTNFDVYGSALQSYGSTTNGLNRLASIYDTAQDDADDLDIGFIPTATPGFNDKGVRDGHPAAPRYMADEPDSSAGELFDRMLEDVVVPRTDPAAHNVLMINSFNEWHEDTQIEPTILAEATNTDDSARQYFTEGHFYEGYGDLYLSILRSATFRGVLGDMNIDGALNGLDVDPFVDVLLNGPYQPVADMNQDSGVNGMDVDPFVAAVLGGVAHPRTLDSPPLAHRSSPARRMAEVDAGERSDGAKRRSSKVLHPNPRHHA